MRKKITILTAVVLTILQGVQASTVPAQAEASGQNEQPQQLPYTYTFAEHQSTFSTDWTVVDRNGDGSLWDYSEWLANAKGDMGVANCTGCFIGDKKGDDWLISSPLEMEAGPHYLLFDLQSVSDTQTEKIEVCIGESDSPDGMDVIGTFDISSTLWRNKLINFEVSDAGTYHIAFHCISEAGLNVRIGYIEVGDGVYTGTPEIHITDVIVPYSNCDLHTDERIGIAFENRGTAAISDMTLVCDVKGPGDNLTLTQMFDNTVAPDATAVLMLDTPVDFSAPGDYDISFKLSGGGTSAADGTSVTCFEPYTGLPVTTDFSNYLNAEFWTWMSADGWGYEPVMTDFTATSHGTDHGLLSRGIFMERPVRFKISYIASGMWTTGMTIYMGKAGEDPSSYRIIYEDSEVTNVPVEREITVEPETPGNYSFVIADTGSADSRSFLRLNQVTISELLEHDLRIENVEAPESRYMPAALTGGEMNYKAVVLNRGSETMTGVGVNVLHNGTKAGASSAAVTLSPGESAEISVTAQVPSTAADDRFLTSFEVFADTPDQYAADNTVALPETTVTTDMLGNENITDLKYGVGDYSSYLHVGNFFTLSKTADLTSAQIGFTNTTDQGVADSAIELTIYAVDGDRPGRVIFNESRPRGFGGFMDFDFDDMRLAPGTYYFEAGQLSKINMGLAVDPDNTALCWEHNDDGVSEVETYALCIRAFFAGESEVYAKDAIAYSIDTPESDSALMYDNETVSVRVRNGGYETYDTDVTLSVDGTSCANRTVTLLPYETAKVDFPDIDLSAAGEHILAISVGTDDDARAENNSVTRIINSEKELDSYLMDFEGCPDFAGNGARLNPRWTTEDRNGIRTDYFWRYNHDNREEPCGFMAYNVHATVPSMDDEPLDGFYPHSGDRMGVAFTYMQWAPEAAGLTQSDVWMVSPELKLGDGSSFELYVKTYALESPSSQPEPFRLLVSDNGDSYDSFRILGADTRIAAVDEWELVTADLSEYDNRNVRVAVQYIGDPAVNCCLMIDDLHVKTNHSGVEGVTGQEGLRLSYDPSSQHLYFSGEPAGKVFEIFSASGMNVMSGSASPSVDVSHLSPGVYMVRCGNSMLKFTK